MAGTVVLCSEGMWGRGHGREHPLKPERLRRTYELLLACRAFEAPGSRLLEPAPATREELTLFHSEEYLDAVARLSHGETEGDAGRYNFGPGDNPVFPGMYETEALKTGGAMAGARILAAGEATTAFSFAGGLHHARPATASGFCVFNDAAVAIRWLVGQGLRVAYVDIDVHHGDGVQEAFYETDQVLTVSIHQDPRTLFPGTGFPREIGFGAGRGFSANVPLSPYTTDDVYLETFLQVVPPLVLQFAPDILVTQLGIDTHFADPLAKLMLTTRGFARLVEELRALADTTRGWLALGGGGYSVDVVPRAWALAYGLMAGIPLPEDLPDRYARLYGGASLHDREMPAVSGDIVDFTRTCAGASVDALRSCFRGIWDF
jgi:acetoin utilization protein AcuC